MERRLEMARPAPAPRTRVPRLPSTARRCQPPRPSVTHPAPAGATPISPRAAPSAPVAFRHASDDLSRRRSAREEEWLNGWLATRCDDCPPDEVAFLQYTSGSTGHPKGVMVGTRNLVANIDAIAQVRMAQSEMGALPAEEVGVASWLPQYHDMGLIGGCLSAAIRGWRADLTSPFTFLQRPVVWLQMITRMKDTHLVQCTAPNFGYALCIRRVKGDALAKRSLAHWKVAMNGAEPIRASTVTEFSARFASCGFESRAWAPVFGLAENCLYCCGRAEETVILQVDRACLGVGDKPMPQTGPIQTSILEACGHYILPESSTNQMVKIVHNETCEERPDGTVGEIWVCGPSVAGGYWQLEDLSTDTFRARIKSTTNPTDAPHLRSGDLGFIWERRLYIVGRIKDVLTIKGRTLHAHDIEVCAERGGEGFLRPGCCAAIPITAEGGEDTLVIMSEIRPEASTNPADLEQNLRGVVSEISESEGVRPSAIVLITARSILKTTSGKLRRREMRQAYAQLVLGERPAEKWQFLIPESAVVHVWKDTMPLPAPARKAPEPAAAASRLAAPAAPASAYKTVPPQAGGREDFSAIFRHGSGDHYTPVQLSFTGKFEENAKRFGARRLYSWMRGDCSEEASLSFAELREQACNLCVALRQKWGANTGDRVMLVYPPGLDFLVAFFGAQYAAVIAVPYYPPIMPTSPMPSAGAKKLLADGLEKLSRISQSCSPILFLSTKVCAALQHRPPRPPRRCL